MLVSIPTPNLKCSTIKKTIRQKSPMINKAIRQKSHLPKKKQKSPMASASEAAQPEAAAAGTSVIHLPLLPRHTRTNTPPHSDPLQKKKTTANRQAQNSVDHIRDTSNCSKPAAPFQNRFSTKAPEPAFATSTPVHLFPVASRSQAFTPTRIHRVSIFIYYIVLISPHSCFTVDSG
jgi:hypothetical protein